MEKKDPKTQYAHILYRDGEYKKWQPCRITIPPGIDLMAINNFINEDLDKQQIKRTHIKIQKITN